MTTVKNSSTIETIKKPPLLTPLLLIFMFAMILANLGGNMFYPLEALYLKDLGAEIAQIGLFYTISQIIPPQILAAGYRPACRLRAIAIGSVGYFWLYTAHSWLTAGNGC